VDCWRFEETVFHAKRYDAYGQGEETRRFLAEARALYRGPFLPAVRERWAEVRRYSLERQIVWIESHSDRDGDRAKVKGVSEPRAGPSGPPFG
jgi:hypothetical protein